MAGYGITIEISQGEKLLFEHYGYGWAVNDDTTLSSVGILPLYKMVVETAFLQNENSVFDRVLRSVLHALENCVPYRGTPEFEKLFEPIL